VPYTLYLPTQYGGSVREKDVVGVTYTHYIYRHNMEVLFVSKA